MTQGPFDDVLAANVTFAEQYAFGDLEPRAAMLLAVLTCMDSRVDPLRMLGLGPGDAKILRNAGGRVTDDVLATLVIAHHLLGAARFMVIAHTGCAMASASEASIHEAIAASGGPDTRSLRFVTAEDQEASLRDDVARVRAFPFLTDLTVGAFLYDVRTGRLRQVC